MICLNAKVNLTHFHFREGGIEEHIKQNEQNHAEILQQTCLMHSSVLSAVDYGTSA